LIVDHGDTDNEHVHVIVNRVADDGRAWKPAFDLVKAGAAVRMIEADFGLIREGRGNRSSAVLSPGAYLAAARTGRKPFCDRVCDQAAGAFAEAAGWQDLEARLAARGFRIQPADGHPGVVVTDGAHFTSLSRVDQSLSGPKLARRFGETFEDHRRAHPEPPAVLAPAPEAAPRAAGSLEHRAAALLDRIAATLATFTEADLRRGAFYQPDSVALVRAALSSDRVLDLGKTAGGVSRYTTREYLQAEARLLAAAASLSSRDHHRLDLGARDRAPDPAAPAAGDNLAGRTAELHAAEPGSAERRAAVLHAAAAPDLAQIVGTDDAARTAAARDVAAAYQERGYDVRGTAVTARAAAALENEAGIRSSTLASLERDWSQGAAHLHPRSVLVLDEAGMLDVRRLGRVLAHAEERHAKVVLLGDPDRLQTIGAGDAFRGLVEHYPSASLDTAGRRAAFEQLAGGRIAAALDRCEEAGRLHWSDSRAAARAQLLDSHTRDRRQDPGGARLILAQDPADVAWLNDAVRAERRAAGEIGPGVRAGRTEVACGDRIVFLRDDPQGQHVRDIGTGGPPGIRQDDRQGPEVRELSVGAAAAVPGVRRGALGTIVTAEPRRIAVLLDDGRTVAFDPVRYRAVAHSYAVTVRQARAAAADRVYVLADPRMDRHAAGVALTGHRHRLDLFADRETFPSREHLDKALSRAGHKDLAGDYAAAELRRAAARLNSLAAETNRVVLEERPLREALAALSSLREARQHVVESRRSLAGAAGQVYADPGKALRGLLRDPEGPARLRRGEARIYGKLQGGIGPGAPRRERARALNAALTLSGRLDAHQRTVAGLHAVKETAVAKTRQLTIPSLQPQPRAVPAFRGPARGLPAAGERRAPGVRLPSAAQVGAELTRVTARLGACRQAVRDAQDALETAVRAMGRTTLDSALLLLPPKLALPVDVAVRAVARALDRGLDLGLGR
ncbi:MAG TPA: AAA family ATPase, partial [Thermoanaerobaculia bacterium]|nr:AAA family ATPase [Thermoanaerobaculia bacterium]